MIGTRNRERILEDVWEPRPPLLLDGWIERRGHAPAWMACMVLFIVFVLFQVVVGPISVFVILMSQGVTMDRILQDFGAVLEEHAAAPLVANTIAQAIGIALPAWLFARMHTRRPSAFLRMRRTDVAFMVLGALSIVVLMPVTQWLSMVNAQIPLPDALQQLEASHNALIERVLSTDRSVLFNVAVLALAPALCEEVLFRGYVQREAERGMGVLGGILFSGIAFGVYHLRFSQVLPLCMIGVFLAYLVWRTGSLWPAVVVHFVNNAIAVVLAAFASRNQALDMADMERVQVPWYLVVAGLLLFAALMRSLHRMTMDRHARAGHARELGKVGYAGDAEDAGDADGTFPGGMG